MGLGNSSSHNVGPSSGNKSRGGTRYDMPHYDRSSKKEKIEEAKYKIGWWRYQLDQAKTFTIYTKQEQKDQIQRCKNKIKGWKRRLKVLKEE